MEEDRFILILTGKGNESLLYEYASIVRKVGKVGIVKIPASVGNVDYVANYQLNRLPSGRANVGDSGVFTSQTDAVADAMKRVKEDKEIFGARSYLS